MVEWHQIRLEQAGFSIQLSRSQWGSNGATSESMVLRGVSIPRSDKASLTILGVELAMSACTGVSLDDRIRKT